MIDTPLLCFPSVIVMHQHMPLSPRVSIATVEGSMDWEVAELKKPAMRTMRFNQAAIFEVFWKQCLGPGFVQMFEDFLKVRDEPENITSKGKDGFGYSLAELLLATLPGQRMISVQRE